MFTTRHHTIARLVGICCLLTLAGVVKGAVSSDSSRSHGGDKRITVATYYFGNYHPDDPRNEKFKGKGWSEWELLKAAKPRFAGHQQPKAPAWGYTDESDPNAMAQKIDAAADHGIDAFIFDWYQFNDGDFLQGALEDGFLKAPNRDRLKFAVMWANEDWPDMFPYQDAGPKRILIPGKVTPETFHRTCDYVIRSYFLRPNYWRIDGKPYFSIYNLTNLLAAFDGVGGTRDALDRCRAKARAAGFPDLHLNAVVWGKPTLPNESAPADVGKLVRDLGFDSVTSYVWIHHVELPRLETDYNEARDQYFAYWDEVRRKFAVPYIPNVTMGWDGTPRAYEVRGGNILSDNTPERFQEALRLAKEKLLAEPHGPRILNINAWNEWTEGSYLEPDTVHGMKYLEAIRATFPRNTRATVRLPRGRVVEVGSGTYRFGYPWR